MRNREDVEVWAKDYLSDMSGEGCSKTIAAKVFSFVWERMGQQPLSFIPVKQRELPTNLYTASQALNALVKRNLLLRGRTTIEGNLTLVYGLGPAVPTKFLFKHVPPSYEVRIENIPLVKVKQEVFLPTPEELLRQVDNSIKSCLEMQTQLLGLFDEKALKISAKLFQVMNRIRLFQRSCIEDTKTKPDLATIIKDLSSLEREVKNSSFKRKGAELLFLTRLHSCLANLLEVASQKAT